MSPNVLALLPEIILTLAGVLVMLAEPCLKPGSFSVLICLNGFIRKGTTAERALQNSAVIRAIGHRQRNSIRVVQQSAAPSP